MMGQIQLNTHFDNDNANIKGQSTTINPYAFSQGQLLHFYDYQYGRACKISLIKKTNKTLTFQCFFNNSLDAVQVKFINMTHINLFFKHHLKHEQDFLCSFQPYFDHRSNQFERGCFEDLLSWSLEETQQQVKISSKDQSLQSKNKYRERLARLIFEISLRKIQYDEFSERNSKQHKNKKDYKRYFYGSDGILYNNVAIYSKLRQFAFQINKQQSKGHDQLIIRNKLQFFHFIHISCPNLREDSLINVVDVQATIKKMNVNTNNANTTVNEQKEVTEYKLQLKPSLKIDQNIKPLPLLPQNQMKKEAQLIDSIFNQEEEQLRKIFCILKQKNNKGQNKNKQINIQINSRGPQITNLQKLLELPRIYIIMQEYNSIDKFQNQLRILKKGRILQQEHLWYLLKYEQIWAQNNVSMTLGNQLPNIQIKQISFSNNNSPVTHQPSSSSNLLKGSLKNISKSPTVYRQNSSMSAGSSPLINTGLASFPNFNFQNYLDNYQNSCKNNNQVSTLLKEYKNLQQDRFVSSQQYESVLGWGQLNCLYHFNNADKHTYIIKLQKYLKKLQKYKNYSKVRKQYLFYSAKLFELKERYSESIFYMRQCLKIIKKLQHVNSQTSSQKLLSIEQAVVCHELGRLLTQIKKYRQSIYWYNASIQMKQKIFQKFSLQILSNVYNILFVYIYYGCKDNQKADDSKNSCKMDGMDKYIRMLASIKQKNMDQICIKQWFNRPNFKQSIMVITKVQQYLVDLYKNPWRQIQDRLLTKIRSKNTMNVAYNGRIGGKPLDLNTAKQKNRNQNTFEQQKQIYLIGNENKCTKMGRQISHQVQSKQVSDFHVEVLACSVHNGRSFARLNEICQKLQRIGTSSYELVNKIRMNILCIYAKQLALVQYKINHRHQHSLRDNQQFIYKFIGHIQQLKKLVHQLQDNKDQHLHKIGVLNNKMGNYIRQIVYEWYKIANIYSKTLKIEQCTKIDWQWILNQYFCHILEQQASTSVPSQQTGQLASYPMYSNIFYQRIKLLPINHLIQYCLLSWKYSKDYGRMFNVLAAYLKQSQKDNTQNTSPTSQNNQNEKINLIIDIVMEPHGKIMINMNKIQQQNDRVVILYMISISLCHMHKYKQLQSILQLEQTKTIYTKQQIVKQYQQKHEQNQTKNKDKNGNGNGNEDKHSYCYCLQQLIGKQNIYSYQFYIMLMICYYNCYRIEDFVKLYELLFMRGSSNLTSNNMGNSQSVTIISMMAINCYLQLKKKPQNQTETNQKCIDKILQIYQANSLLACKPNLIILKILADKMVVSKQHMAQFIQYVTNMLLRQFRLPKLQQMEDGYMLQLLQICGHQQQLCNYNQFYCKCIKMITQYIKTNASNNKTTVQQSFKLVVQLLTPIMQNIHESRKQQKKHYLLQLLSIYSSKQAQSEQKQGKIVKNVCKQLMIKLLNEILTVLDITVNISIQAHNRQLPQIFATWIPILMHAINHMHSQHRDKSMVKQWVASVMGIILKWCRYAHLAREAVLCAVWLHVHSPTQNMPNINNMSINADMGDDRGSLIQQQYNQLITHILPFTFDCNNNNNNRNHNDRRVQNESIQCPQLFHQLSITPQINTILAKLHTLRNQCYFFMARFNTLREDGGTTDMDAYVQQIQQLIDALEPLKANLSAILPNYYMNPFEQLLDAVRQQIQTI